MKTWFDRLLLIALLVVIAILTVTAIPLLRGEHLSGRMLFAHMRASGALVIVLPIFAINGLLKHLNHNTSGAGQRLGYWTVLVTGLLTIATIFVCMLPVPSTAQMETLIQWHGYAGYAMVASAILLCLGIWSFNAKETAASKNK
jgi:hypothetical protein